MIVAVPDEVVLLLTLSLEVAKILRDLISSKDKPGSGSIWKGCRNLEEVRTVRVAVVILVIDNVCRVASHIGLESRASLLKDRGNSGPEIQG